MIFNLFNKRKKMEIKLEHHLDSIVIPANLRINDQIKTNLK